MVNTCWIINCHNRSKRLAWKTYRKQSDFIAFRFGSKTVKLDLKNKNCIKSLCLSKKSLNKVRNC